jgi:hypothetical protein
MDNAGAGTGDARIWGWDSANGVWTRLLVDVDGNLKTTSTGSGGGSGATTPSTVRAGQKNVTTAGTPVAIASTAAVQAVIVRSKDTNTSNIFVGASGVTSATGHILAPGESVGIAIDDLAKVYVDAAVNGEGVTFLGS